MLKTVLRYIRKETKAWNEVIFSLMSWYNVIKLHFSRESRQKTNLELVGLSSSPPKPPWTTVSSWPDTAIASQLIFLSPVLPTHLKQQIWSCRFPTLKKPTVKYIFLHFPKKERKNLTVVPFLRKDQNLAPAYPSTPTSSYPTCSTTSKRSF